MLVWDNESGIGQHRKLTVAARGFAGTLATRIYQTAPRDPEAKGVVERANGFLQTSFMPGRSFTSGADFNAQLEEWLPRANNRLVRATGARPVERVGADRAAMGVLPPPAPRGRIPTNLTPKQRMTRKLRTIKGKADYARRKAIVEPVFGQVQVAQAGHQLRLRGT